MRPLASRHVLSTPSCGCVRPSRKSAVTTRAFWGQGDSEAKRQKKAEQDAAWEAQQEVLRRRRDGSWQKDVKSRRADVRKYNTDPEYKKEVDERNRQKFLKEQKENPPPFAFIVPVSPLGLPEYDGGERFDLKGGYVDNGWVEEGATSSLGDFGKAIGNFFTGKGKKGSGEGSSTGESTKQVPEKGKKR